MKMNESRTANRDHDGGGLLTSKEAARFLGVSERTLWTIKDEGRLPSIKVRRCVRYKMDDLMQYIDGLRMPGSNTAWEAA